MARPVKITRTRRILPLMAKLYEYPRAPLMKPEPKLPVNIPQVRVATTTAELPPILASGKKAAVITPIDRIIITSPTVWSSRTMTIEGREETVAVRI